MKPAIKLLLRRSLMTLGAIVVWAKALAGGRADGQTQSTPETDQKTAGGDSKSPTVNANDTGCRLLARNDAAHKEAESNVGRATVLCRYRVPRHHVGGLAAG